MKYFCLLCALPKTPLLASEKYVYTLVSRKSEDATQGIRAVFLTYNPYSTFQGGKMRGSFITLGCLAQGPIPPGLPGSPWGLARVLSGNAASYQHF